MKVVKAHTANYRVYVNGKEILSTTYSALVDACLKWLEEEATRFVIPAFSIVEVAKNDEVISALQWKGKAPKFHDASLLVNLSDVYETDANVQLPEPCGLCEGKGSFPGFDGRLITCTECQGSGID